MAGEVVGVDLPENPGAPVMVRMRLHGEYRRLVRENHPDAMMSRGVPEEFIHLANDKVAAINIAYETIEKARRGLS